MADSRNQAATGRHRAVAEENTGLSVRRAVAIAGAQLSEAGVPSARVDAELLASFALQVPRAQLGLVSGFTDEQADRFEELIAERVNRVPLQHLTGEAAFRYLSLAVGPGVFIPRPETEYLVEWGLEKLRGVESAVAVDLCAGSGAIALSLAHEMSNVNVHAVEQDELAVAWLQRNAKEQAGKGDHPVDVYAEDATSSETLAESNGAVDLVLSNPPYIPLGSSVAHEVHHDPAHALWGGVDGLDVVRGVIVTASRLLKPGGWFGFEHGEQHTFAAAELLDAQEWTSVDHLDDLTGRPRFTIGQRR
ncbi:MAG: peptide chain release factor N(5)-glutamine methyltransferase [Corynebacteriales bacterium]|nr:peptide chain release factor N(5)-glutamine methyltransferase [Mycobacteriales bacterium]